MSRKYQKTTTSGIDWNTMLGLLHRLKKDNKYREYLLIGTGCYLGLRASDLLNLKWTDILEKDEIFIVEKKTQKVRSITINKELKKIIADSNEYFSNEIKLNNDSYLFSNKSGGKLSIQYVNRTLHKIMNTYNVKVQNPSTHTLRKTFGKRVWEMDNKSDRALIYLSQIFNHSNSMITRKYIGIIQEDISNIYLGL